MVNWEEKTQNDYIRMCYPKPNQDLYIHSEDVVCLLKVLKEHKPKVILEIGAAFGTSTKLFAAIAQEFGGHVYTIEPSPKQEFYKNLEEYGLQNEVTLVQGESPWINWGGQPNIDFVFIDGFHNFRNAFTDYFYWQKYLNKNGIIAFHDTNKFTQVSRAVDEILRCENLELIATSNSKCGMKILQQKDTIIQDAVFFGPWVGEFGYEVAWWQGYCRREAKKYKYSIASSYETSRDLYIDFVDEFRPHSLIGNPICGFANNLSGNFEYPYVKKVIPPPEKKFIPAGEQDFIMFGQDDPNTKYDLLIHVNEHKRKTYKEWDKLLESLKDFNMACVGMKGKWADGLLEGTDDLRGINLNQLAQYMAGCKVLFGPSSGLMHFGSFCNAKIVVWGDKGGYTWGQSIRQRFETIINPFGNNNIVLDKWGWSPPVEEVVNALTKFL